MDINFKTIVGVIKEANTRVTIIAAMAIAKVIEEARPIAMVQ